MARVERQRAAWLIVAENDDERALLAYGRTQGGAVTLLESFYSIRDDTLLLPSRSTATGARRVCAAFERAAQTHREAQRRRCGFRLLKSSDLID